MKTVTESVFIILFALNYFNIINVEEIFSTLRRFIMNKNYENHMNDLEALDSKMEQQKVDSIQLYTLCLNYTNNIYGDNLAMGLAVSNLFK
jgi:hypothetical protein